MEQKLEKEKALLKELYAEILKSENIEESKDEGIKKLMEDSKLLQESDEVKEANIRVMFTNLQKYTKNPELRQKVIEKRKEAPLFSGHGFWGKQPVMQFDCLDKEDMPIGLIEKADPEKVPSNPYPLPEDLEWSDIDVTNPKELDEVYTLLRDYYIEEYSNEFRMRYSHEYLKWIFAPPERHKDWAVGIRAKGSKELIGFLNIAPLKVCMAGVVTESAEPSFAAISAKYRNKRILPILAAETIRRLRVSGIWHFYFSTDRVLCAPIAGNWFYRRDLDFKLTVEINTNEVPEGKTMEEMVAAHQMPESANIPGLREMTKEDIPQVHALLSEYLKKFTLYPIFTQERIAHMLLPQKDVIRTYVLANKDNKVTDFISFYIMPYTVLKHPTIKEVTVIFLAKHRVHFYSTIRPPQFPWLTLLMERCTRQRNRGFLPWLHQTAQTTWSL
eukprot:TRINITY_DN1992_c0_g1_i3.p1 TRINITY_DN1992_c0_g1~~TRINITY_DN1992_c0_g1_i3.p1  ORF type:complete len:444 (+),score=91.14 TRINITY_DN1992_c0_g1_i3:198-1529(+)